ncbi:DUF5069 domain-containing protein [Leptospirillum ferriphilum]|uniref:DUF5069 domain-containing protein n=1 Tax=Leptospirillum ferriphilum TaxID=178606 RepID=UPI003EE7BB1F
MDLTKQFPRSPVDRLGGMDHLKRVIDKARAHVAGTLGEYTYNCPLDQAFFSFFGLDHEKFAEAVKSRPGDQDMLAWVHSQAPRSKNPEEVESFNREYESRSPDSPEKWDYFRSVRDSLAPGRTDITTWVKLLDLEEKRPV